MTSEMQNIIKKVLRMIKKGAKYDLRGVKYY